MVKTFWNLSNHPIASSWSSEQQAAARQWHDADELELRDFPFPNVDPIATKTEVQELADSTVSALLEAGALAGEPVMVMGEFTLAFALVERLKAAGIIPVTASTEREAREECLPDGRRRMEHFFRFVAFRAY